MRILVVEDEKRLASTLADLLSQETQGDTFRFVVEPAELVQWINKVFRILCLFKIDIVC